MQRDSAPTLLRESLLAPPPPPSHDSSAIPRPLLIIFFLSGLSALIDQIVWSRSLYRIFGVTATATATVLAAFMAGLALGSYAFGRLADRRGHGLRLYAAMELGIGILAPLTLLIFRGLQPLYASVGAALGLDSIWLPPFRCLACLLVLLPPTILMGGTLPVLAKSFLRRHPGRVVASLYSINTWGAVLGCFLAGYILLGTLGESRSLLLAAAGNLLSAAWAFSVARKLQLPAPATSETTLDPRATPPRVILYISFINGFAALALEVLWGRTIGLFTDASVYAFTGIIGIFLIGIALGSRLVAPWVDRLRHPGAVLSIIVAVMSIAMLLATRAFVSLQPADEIGRGWSQSGLLASPLLLPLRTIAMSIITVLPVTLLSGACMPLMARLVLVRAGREATNLGLVYSINTLGGILGAALTGLLLLPTFGDQGSFFLIAMLYMSSAVAGLWSEHRALAALASAAACLAVGLLVMPPGGSLSRPKIATRGTIYRHVETAAGTVTALTQKDGMKSLLVNGVGMTVLCTDTKLLAHLPLALHPHPQNALVICFGMGTTFRSASRHNIPVTAVELQPAVPQMFPLYYADAAAVLANPLNHVVIADGRNFLLVSKQQYSIIAIDPAPPIYSAGTVNLYTREFFLLCRDHLDSDGIMSLWVPDHACTIEEFQILLRTYCSGFPHVEVWAGPDISGYICLGSQHPLEMRPARAAAVFEDPAIVRDLHEMRPVHTSRTELPAIRLMDSDTTRRFTSSDSTLLTDDTPWTEFPWLRWLSLGSSFNDHWLDITRLSSTLQSNHAP